MIENTVSTLFSQRITPRETQVVAQVLEGHSSDSIAKNLGISVGTVRIHRRNIYAKLRISSQQELFSIFLKKSPRGADRRACDRSLHRGTRAMPSQQWK